MTTTDPTAPAVLDEETISAYRRDGVVRIRNIISTEEAARFRDAAIAASASADDYANGSPIFKQHVNVWRDDAVLRELTLDPRLAAAATALAGVPVRIWHDQLLIKPPHNGAATEFHQDAPYWPHAGSRASLSAWVALVDVPVERGCMTFIPGSQRHQDLRSQDLADRDDMFRAAPDLRWEERLTIPLRAGRLHLPQRLPGPLRDAEPHRRSAHRPRRHLHRRGHHVHRCRPRRHRRSRPDRRRTVR